MNVIPCQQHRNINIRSKSPAAGHVLMTSVRSRPGPSGAGTIFGTAG